MRTIDNLLNRITMYRLVLYELIFLLVSAGILGYFGALPYSPLAIAASTAFITIISWTVNRIFSAVFESPENPESVYITAFILALIVTPPGPFPDMNYLSLAGWSAALAMASKYILAIRKKHLFNPAAIAVAIMALALNQSASWWIGTLPMLPFVFLGGFLITRKMQRFDMVFVFLLSAFVSIVGESVAGGGHILTAMQNGLLHSPALFFATVMLTEPFTTPPVRHLRVLYGALVGFLFAPWVHIGSIFSTPELALLVGNAFSYIVSPKQKLTLSLREKNRLSTDTYEFVFTPDQRVSFRPGQYMEWTFAHPGPDARGVRRYFTLASSPTEEDVRLGVKFYPGGSSFKKRLFAMRAGETIVASQRAGDFVLPEDTQKKLAFIAGGIGITPFRSMLKYLMDRSEPRSMVLLYSNKTPSDVAYQDFLETAKQKLGLKTVYSFSDPGATLSSVPGVVGKLDARTIAAEVPDYLERVFYLSGPHGMVNAFDDMLRNMGVKASMIKKDFFPGFA